MITFLKLCWLLSALFCCAAIVYLPTCADDTPVPIYLASCAVLFVSASHSITKLVDLCCPKGTYHG